MVHVVTVSVRKAREAARRQRVADTVMAELEALRNAAAAASSSSARLRNG